MLLRADWVTGNTPKLSDNRLEHRECRFTFDIQETK